jgi:Na+/proline symporter
MRDGWHTALRVARLALLVSVVAYGLALLLSVAGYAGEFGSLFGLIAAGWIVLSAISCLVIQLGLVLRRRTRRGSRVGEAQADGS